MTARTQCSGLSVARELYELIRDEIAPGTGIDPIGAAFVALGATQFIGLGVDFAIHLGMAYADGLRVAPDNGWAVHMREGIAQAELARAIVAECGVGNGNSAGVISDRTAVIRCAVVDECAVGDGYKAILIENRPIGSAVSEMPAEGAVIDNQARAIISDGATRSAEAVNDRQVV